MTAAFVITHLLNRGAGTVKLAVLVDKQTQRINPIIPDYACFTVKDVWLSGMGMDDARTAHEAHRWDERIMQAN